MKKHIRLLTLAAISLAGFTYGNQLQASSPDNAIFSQFLPECADLLGAGARHGIRNL